MTESLLHFIWQHRPFTLNGLRTEQGQIIEVIDAGLPNTDAGPDFFNAKIKLNGELWAGNVEMHLKASDWYAHGHHTDPRYDNVVLHVVLTPDRPALCASGQAVPTLAVPRPIDIETRHDELMAGGGWIPCHGHLAQLNGLQQLAMLQRLMVERLQQKSEMVLAEVERCKGSWEEAYYRAVTRCFGLKVNAQPAELLARSLPLAVLAKHKNSLFQIEALLFGQAGLLAASASACSYASRLQREYAFLSHKYALTPIDSSQWRFMRMRPISFPSIRLAQLAALISGSSGLFSRCMEANSLDALEQLLNATPSEFWATHYTLGGREQQRLTHKAIGSALKHTIILNATVPFMFAYGAARSDDSLRDKSLRLLETMPPEENSVVSNFHRLGLKLESAADTQAVVHLKATRCEAKKCLYCEVGAAYIEQGAIRSDPGE